MSSRFSDTSLRFIGSSYSVHTQGNRVRKNVLGSRSDLLLHHHYVGIAQIRGGGIPPCANGVF